jgi:small subunit ribosomal protein S11
MAEKTEKKSEGKAEHKSEKPDKAERKSEKPDKAEHKSERPDKAERKSEKPDKADGGAQAEGKEKAAVVKKVKKRAAADGIAHVRSTFNNTIINISDSQGNVIAWGSPGKSGFKGSRKSTPFAAQIAAEVVGKAAYDAGVRKVEVHIKGAGNGRESSIRALAAAGLRITAIKDYTAIPHNGCRPPKRRRV